VLACGVSQLESQSPTKEVSPLAKASTSFWRSLTVVPTPPPQSQTYFGDSHGIEGPYRGVLGVPIAFTPGLPASFALPDYLRADYSSRMTLSSQQLRRCGVGGQVP